MSNTSSSSNTTTTNVSAVDNSLHPHSADLIPSTAVPHASRRHRSSSASVRSMPGHGTLTSTMGSTTNTSQASVDRARDATGMRSRENSLAGVGLPPLTRSRAPSASPSPRLAHGGPGQHDGQQSHQQHYFSTGRARRGSGASMTRWEETERAKAVLDLARIENEALIARVRELEGLLKAQQ